MNKSILMGRLTKDPELRTTQTGLSVVSFTLAVDRRGKEKATDFINCVAWDKTAEFIKSHFAKGQKIGITGRLQSRSYQDRDGNNRNVIEVVAREVDFCSEKPAAPAAAVQDIEGDDDELPF